MRTMDQEKFEKFSDFVLSDEEMILVRGGDGDETGRESAPPVTEPEI